MLSTNKDKRNKNYKICLIDDLSHKYLWAMRLTRNSLFVTIISIITVLFAIAFAIIALTPVKTLIPGYPYASTRLTAIKNEMKIDSLKNIIQQWDFYSENLKKVLDGEDAAKIDSIIKNTQGHHILKLNEKKYARQDSILRENIKKSDKFVISNHDRRLPIEGEHFFTPIKGIISKYFIEGVHPYVDINATANSVVMSALDGTVINAGWSEKHGFTIVIQHPNNIVTIYKNNEKLLKQVGDNVKAGTPIAIVGNNAENNSNIHLRFELWHNGKAIDPRKFINF